MPTVTRIPPRIRHIQQNSADAQRIRRVAGYARVSTDTEEQKNSYAAQVEFYTKYIQERPDWEYCGIYTDEAVTATNTKHRSGFNKMVKEALAGRFDLIVTKSVSRFARNTVDTLNTIRLLKEHGVEVYFEKENIWTFDGKGEVLITIMSSLAQEESRSLSENVKWGIKRKQDKGEVSLPYKRFLGYKKGGDGRPEIVEEEAETVRLIFKLFLQGRTLNAIATHLTEGSFPTPSGKTQWSVSTINSILRNEKYKGDALLQKSYTTDFITKKKKKNKGEVPQVYVENSHDPIVSPEVFDMAQEEIRRRKESGSRQQNGQACFSSRIVCGVCGGYFGSKVWHSNSPYRRTIWQCNHKYKGGEKCGTPHVYEDDIQKAFIEAFNRVVGDKERTKQDCREAMDILTDTSALDAESAEICAELEVVAELTRKAVAENARAKQDQDEYRRRYDALTTRYDALSERLENIEAEKRGRAVTRERTACLIAAVDGAEILAEFDEELWRAAVVHITVYADGSAAVTFRDGRTESVTV